MGYGGSAEYVKALQDTVVAVMIEKKGAVDELDEILELPGLDMVQWGGSDFSVSIGKPGQRNDPEVMAAHDKVFKESIAAGVHARAEIQSADDARRYLGPGRPPLFDRDRYYRSCTAGGSRTAKTSGRRSTASRKKLDHRKGRGPHRSRQLLFVQRDGLVPIDLNAVPAIVGHVHQAVIDSD